MLTVSDTAFAIATIRAMESELPASSQLFVDPYASLFAAAGAHAAEGTKRFLSLPFFRDGIRLRTRGIDDFVRAGLADGLDQIVVLGAGFDARGLRMPEVAAHGARVYEVDFAALLEAKRALLIGAGISLPASMAHVACDFKEDFEEALAAELAERGFRRGAGALFVWEGVVAYIDRAAVDRTLRFMASAGGKGSRAVFDFGPSVFEPDTALACAQRAGFTACEEVRFDELWRRYLPGEPHENAAMVSLAMPTV
jgi:methyltransferase (TIGR00027 family)